MSTQSDTTGADLNSGLSDGSASISQDALDQLFLNARTFNAWQDRPVTEETLHELYNLLKMAPTSANCSPARFYFLTTPEAKEKLKPALAAGNVDKTMTAPVTVIIADNHEFYEDLPKLFPHTDAKSWFVGNEDLIQETAFRNGTLQGAYLMLAARAVGLDCGAMSGFDQDQVNETFFKDTPLKANFLCNLGYGDRASLHARSPRLTFAEACEIL